MTLLALALVVAALLCVLFDTTRLLGVGIGVAGAALLFYLYPLLFSALLVLLALGGVALLCNLFFIHRKRRPLDAIPKLPDADLPD